MLGGICFLNYGTFILILRMVWSAGSAGSLRIINNNIIYLNFTNDTFCRAGNACSTNVAVQPTCT